MSILKFVGRAALVSIFVQGGLSALHDPKQRARLVERAGLPSPELLTQLNGGVMAASGLMVALGVLPRTFSLTLLASMVPTTVVGHPFWQLEGRERQGQMLHFAKNVAMMGGLLLIVADDDNA